MLEARNGKDYTLNLMFHHNLTHTRRKRKPKKKEEDNDRDFAPFIFIIIFTVYCWRSKLYPLSNAALNLSADYDLRILHFTL